MTQQLNLKCACVLSKLLLCLFKHSICKYLVKYLIKRSTASCVQNLDLSLTNRDTRTIKRKNFRSTNYVLTQQKVFSKNRILLNIQMQYPSYFSLDFYYGDLLLYQRLIFLDRYLQLSAETLNAVVRKLELTSHRWHHTVFPTPYLIHFRLKFTSAPRRCNVLSELIDTTLRMQRLRVVGGAYMYIPLTPRVYASVFALHPEYTIRCYCC